MLDMQTALLRSSLLGVMARHKLRRRAEWALARPQVTFGSADLNDVPSGRNLTHGARV